MSEPVRDGGRRKEDRHLLGSCTPYDVVVSVECALEGSAVVGVTWDRTSSAFIAGSTRGPPWVGVGLDGRDVTVDSPFSTSFSVVLSRDPSDVEPRLGRVVNL